MFSNMTRLQITALYLSLFSREQVEYIIGAITTDPAGVLSAFNEIRNSKAAPPAFLAIASPNRVDTEDLENMMRGIGCLGYSAIKGVWGLQEYKDLFTRLFGVSEAVAEDYARKVTTNDHEATTHYLARIANKAADFLLGPMYNPDTAPPNPDILYELVLVGRESAELAKRISSAEALFSNMAPGTMKLNSGTGLVPVGDIDDIPDGDVADASVVITDPYAFAHHLKAYGDFWSQDLIQPSELGAAKKKKSGFANFLKKAAKVVKKIIKNPLISGALQAIPGVGSIVTGAKALSSLAGDVQLIEHPSMLKNAPTAVNQAVNFGDGQDDDGGPLKVDISHGNVVYPGQTVFGLNTTQTSGPRIL
jgi:hypothetical protein